MKNLSSSFPTNNKKTGFAQPESKDFSISKFTKDLEHIILANDSLQAFEHFWDSILHAFNTTCTDNQVFPYYKDLKRDFDFKTHLCANPHFNPSEVLQAKLNYRSFGDTLCLYLLTPSTVSKASCPKAFVKLLSLKGLKDGFKLLRDFIFQLSPQLDGIFIDFSTAISSLTIVNGEHISKFYSHVQDLSQEIMLANLPDGNAATLLYRFLFLLRQTGNPTILGIIQPYWSKITIFHRNPHHFTLPKLPWELPDIFAELEASEISFLTCDRPPTTSTYFVDDINTSNTTSPEPIASFGTSPLYIDTAPNNNNLDTITSSIAARGLINNNNKHPPRHSSQHHHRSSTSGHKTLATHHTSDGRHFIAEQSSSSRPSCSLCHNKHANPWHDTSTCPLKHPTHIIDKTIRERVMQHNALHGSENKHFSKDLDHPHQPLQPRPAAHSFAQANSAVTNIETSAPSPSTTLNHPDTIDNPDDTSLHEIIETDIFDIPTLPQAHMATTSTPQVHEDYTFDDLIFDPTHYVSYSN
jgi:hypothetical protein